LKQSLINILEIKKLTPGAFRCIYCCMTFLITVVKDIEKWMLTKNVKILMPLSTFLSCQYHMPDTIRPSTIMHQNAPGIRFQFSRIDLRCPPNSQKAQ
jgi:hypothetical protein